MWQAEAGTELALSASPTTAVGQKALALAKRRYSTVWVPEYTEFILEIHSSFCRFFTYRSTNDHWFMMDFCYWVNSSLILHQLLCPCSPDGGFCAYWFKLLYVLVSGPISAAVILWGNSLVFHSIDKASRVIQIFSFPTLFLQYWIRKLLVLPRDFSPNFRAKRCPLNKSLPVLYTIWLH